MALCMSAVWAEERKKKKECSGFFCVCFTLCFVLSDTHVWVNSPVPTKQENGSNLVV